MKIDWTTDEFIRVVKEGGWDYEVGTYEPAEDTAQPEISFNRLHGKCPVMVVIGDVMETTVPKTSAVNWIYVDIEHLIGAPIMLSDARYAVQVYNRRGTSSSYTGNTVYFRYSSDIDIEEGQRSIVINEYPQYYVKSTAFYPFRDSLSNLFKAGRTYKWAAVWRK